MAENSTLLEKLDGLVARFEEISTLITCDHKELIIKSEFGEFRY